jgi:hypothetical protein
MVDSFVLVTKLTLRISYFLVILLSVCSCAGGTYGTGIDTPMYGGGTSGTGLGYNDHAAQPGLEETYQEKTALIGSLVTESGQALGDVSVQSQSRFFIDEDVSTPNGTFVVRVPRGGGAGSRIKIFLGDRVLEAAVPAISPSLLRVEIRAVVTDSDNLNIKIIGQ